MNELLRQKLIEIITEYGRSVIDDPKRCKGLLLDYCGSNYRGEIKILIEALNEGVGTELRNISKGIPKQLILAQQKDKLIALHITNKAAQWTVETWAIALGVVSEAELKSFSQSDSNCQAETPQSLPTPPNFSSSPTQENQRKTSQSPQVSPSKPTSNNNSWQKNPSPPTQVTSTPQNNPTIINRTNKRKTISVSPSRKTDKFPLRTTLIVVLSMLGLGGLGVYLNSQSDNTNLLGKSSSPCVSAAKSSSKVIPVCNPNYLNDGIIPGLGDKAILSNNGKQLITYGNRSNIKVWNLSTGELLRTLKGHSDEINSVAISPDGNTLVSGSDDDTVKVWNMETGELLRTLKGHSGSVRSVAISPNGNTLVSGDFGHNIKVWNIETGELLRTLKGHSRSVRSVAIRPDGKTIVSGSVDTDIRVWRNQLP